MENEIERMNHAWLTIFLLSALALTGCASKQDPRTVRVAVLDGLTDYVTSPDGDVLDEGWWFSSRDRYLTSNIGINVADEIARELDDVAGIDVYSREDLDIYMAQKERLLARQEPELTAFERSRVLLEQDPLDYGRSLNVDYVVAPYVHSSSMVTNRFLSWWYSSMEATVEIYDVEQGVLISAYPFRDTDHLDSQLALAEELAREFTSRVKRKDIFELYP